MAKTQRPRLNGNQRRTTRSPGGTLQAQVKQMLLKDPTLATPQLLVKLEKKGHQPNERTYRTVGAIRWAFLDTVRVLQRGGKLSSKMLEAA